MISDSHDNITTQEPNETPAVQPKPGNGTTDRRSRIPRLLRELLFIAGVIGLYLLLTIFVLPRFGFQT